MRNIIIKRRKKRGRVTSGRGIFGTGDGSHKNTFKLLKLPLEDEFVDIMRGREGCIF